jgi:hypothetical protein
MGKHKHTYQGEVSDKLASMEVEEKFSKEDFIKEHRGDYDFYMDRSFSVLFTHAKKLFPEKEFRTILGFVTRIK